MSSDEGLDVDDLDVEVPTAAYRIGEPGWRKLLWGEKQLKVESGYDSFKETKEASEEIEKFEHKELVTREKMREALREAVQHGREQERRRILKKIEDVVRKKEDQRSKWRDLKKSWEEERNHYSEQNESEKEKEAAEELTRIKHNISVVDTEITALEELEEEVEGLE